MFMIFLEFSRTFSGSEKSDYIEIGVAGAEAACGALTVVCVRRNEAGEMKAASIPQEIADLIEVAPADKLTD